MKLRIEGGPSNQNIEFKDAESGEKVELWATEINIKPIGAERGEVVEATITMTGVSLALNAECLVILKREATDDQFRPLFRKLSDDQQRDMVETLESLLGACREAMVNVTAYEWAERKAVLG